MKTTEEAKEELLRMLEIANVPVRANYRRHEVCSILSISRSQFQVLVGRFEPDPDTGEPLRPDCLRSHMHIRERRVPFYELVSYLLRNNTYQRNNALDPRQLLFWD